MTVLERGSIDKHLTFDVGLIQLSFIPVCSPIIFIIIHATFQSNCAEGLHFSAILLNIIHGRIIFTTAAQCLLEAYILR